MNKKVLFVRLYPKSFILDLICGSLKKDLEYVLEIISEIKIEIFENFDVIVLPKSLIYSNKGVLEKFSKKIISYPDSDTSFSTIHFENYVGNSIDHNTHLERMEWVNYMVGISENKSDNRYLREVDFNSQNGCYALERIFNSI